MWDRQYFSSLAISAAVAAATLAGIVSVLFRLGWAGLLALVMIAGGFLVWFYWGPRPDLARRTPSDEGDEREDG